MRRLERELLDRLKDALRRRPEEPVTLTGRDSRWKRPLAGAEPDDVAALERRDEPPAVARRPEQPGHRLRGSRGS